jgi:hypothetical protein
MHGYRVFGLKSDIVQPAMLQEVLRGLGLDVPFQVVGDDAGWTASRIQLPGNGSPLDLACFLATEDDIRDDLDSWAAWLELQEHNPNFRRLMQHVIATQQMFTLRRPFDHSDDARLDRVCDALTQYLAQATDGIYQVDRQGFFAADGTLLLQEH